MGATIEKSLYIGICKTRFDLFDDVKLELKNGEILSGTIIEIGDKHIILEAESSDYLITPDMIKDYLPN